MAPISIIIRTLNEQRFLDELLTAVKNQKIAEHDVEVVIVDSGSTDDTLKIAKTHSCRITNIDKSDFTFGRSLNVGCEFAKGDFLVFVSGHCVPVEYTWLSALLEPLVEGQVDYSYGRQVGRHPTKFSEAQLFKKYFPDSSRVPQQGFFANNANAAISRRAWESYRFNEELTGLEDMELAQRLVRAGGKIGYVAESAVFHIHDETWRQTRKRYEREALALQKIMPEVHVTQFDFLRYLFAGFFADLAVALEKGSVTKNFVPIIKFRLAQYLGTYIGNHEHRKLSREKKESYFYPTKSI